MGAKASFQGCITHGPWGGSNGKDWIYMPESFINKITISHGHHINSIEFHSENSNGKITSSFLGGNVGNQTNTICISYPNHYLVSIRGTFGNYQGSIIVTSLCFVTNVGIYGPYGVETGTRFSYDGEGGVIVGFHGRVDKYINAIGIYVMPESLALSQNSTCEDDSMNELCCSMSRMAMPRDVGPWGGLGGKPWDDGVFLAVKKIYIHVGKSLNVIYGIYFEYLKRDKKPAMSPMHGGTSVDTLLELVNLDGEDEYLSGISGFYGPVKGYDGLEAITSITIHTNKKIHGPYGKESGYGYSYFSSTASSGKIVGFHGRNDGFLSAIGVHMEYF